MADKKNGAQGADPATATATKRKQLPKIETVRRAMAALGKEASRADIQGYVRQKFGIKIGLDHISNCKGDLAKRAAKAATPASPGSATAKSAAQAGRRPGKPSVPQCAGCTTQSSASCACTCAVGGSLRSSRSGILLEDVLTAEDPDRPYRGRPPTDADRRPGQVSGRASGATALRKDRRAVLPLSSRAPDRVDSGQGWRRVAVRVNPFPQATRSRIDLAKDQGGLCSTPFGITDFFTRPLDTPFSRRGPRVLNAFRHHGLLHQSFGSCDRGSPAGVCSTPFGITDFFTIERCVPLAEIGVPGAQRLYRHHGLLHVAGFAVGMVVLLCSTPFGITDFFTISPPLRYVRRTVLNAFRHHGLLHSTGRATILTRRLVLNAFRHHGLLHNRWAAGWRQVWVLNAFRHHGLLHRDTIYPVCASVASAQRLSASRTSSQRNAIHAANRNLCSTPFGITDFFTAGRWRVLPR